VRTVDANHLKKQINNCYLEWDTDYPVKFGEPTMMNGFKYYLERTAGIRLEFEPEIKNGKMGYGMKRVEIVDDKKYMLWTIKYT